MKSQKNTEIQLAQATKRVFQNNFNLNVQHRHGGAAHCVMVFSETSLERQELFDLRDMSVHLKPALCHIKGHLCILAKMEGLQVYNVTCRIRLALISGELYFQSLNTFTCTIIRPSGFSHLKARVIITLTSKITKQ